MSVCVYACVCRLDICVKTPEEMAREIARGEEAVHGLRRAYGEQGATDARRLVPIIEDSSVPQRVGADTRRDSGGVAAEDASEGGGGSGGGGVNGSSAPSLDTFVVLNAQSSQDIAIAQISSVGESAVAPRGAASATRDGQLSERLAADVVYPTS
jgi:hypothetical protein